jgi:cysteine desulfurase
MKQIYMDYAAATPVDTRVLAAMQPYYAELFHNPSAIYLAGKEAHAHLEMARAKVAGCLGARSAEIIFTSGATEANNLALKGLLAQYPDGQVAASAIEHDAVLGVVDASKLTLIPVDELGIIKIDTLSQSINEHTVLVSVMLANNEIGTIQPIAEVAEIIKQIRQSRKKNGNKMPLYLHTDASQAGLYLDLHVNQLGVDLLTLNAGKMYGPKQSGALFLKR